MKMSPIEAATVKIADLEYQVECLERELGLRPDAERVARWQSVFGMSRHEVIAFDLFYRRRGQVVSADSLLFAIYQGDDCPDNAKNCIAQWVHRLRRKRGLPPGSIENVWGSGWVLTKIGVLAADAALSGE